MHLSVYLTELLKTNDCVIVPDLGGFIANYQTSGYDASSDKFSPPSKEIIFSSKLKKNDGLLVNYVGEKEGVGYLEARKIVSEFVSECLFKLENGEKIVFERIGSLRFDQNDHFVFEADPQVNVRTDAFGLDSFHFPQLVGKYNQPPKPVFQDKDPEPQKNRRPIAKYVLMGLPLLLLLYFIPIKKIFNGESPGPQPSSNTASLTVTDSPVVHSPEAAPTTSAVVNEPKVEQNKQVPDVKEEVKLPEPIAATDHAPVKPAVVEPKTTQPEKSVLAPASTAASKGKFHLVGGCFKIRENADKLAEDLTKKGYHAQVSAMGKGFFRVSVESYQTRKEAEQALGKLLSTDPEGGYWLMADKK